MTSSDVCPTSSVGFATGSHVTFEDVMGRLVLCTAVELMVVMAVNSTSLQSADVIAARQQHQ